MFCSLLTCLWLFLLYKIVDYLIRIPKRSSPSGKMDNIMITGCDSGFGRLCALRLDRKGFRVFAACLTEKGREDLQKASGSGRLNTFIMDVSDTSSIEKAYQHVADSLRPGEGLWGLVNNAGIMQPKLGPSEWLLKEDYQRCCDINLFGLIDVTRTFLPLIKKTQGRIVNTASIVGRMGFPGSAPYVVSKHGVEGYSECLRPEIRAFGISVHIIKPGFHATNLIEVNALTRGTRDGWERLPQHLKDEYPEDYATKANELITELVNRIASTKLDTVVDCYEHALLSYYPRGRYMPGYDARFLWWPLSLAPEWFFDWILNRNPNRPIPTSCRQ